MKHTLGLALLLSLAACGPAFTGGNPMAGDAALDDGDADVRDAAPDTADGGTDAPPADSGADVSDAGTDAGEDVAPQWPPDGEVLGDPDVQEADAATPADVATFADRGTDSGADVHGDTGADAQDSGTDAGPADGGQDASDAGGGDVDPQEAEFARCGVATGCVACVRIVGCAWCYSGQCQPLVGRTCLGGAAGGESACP